MKLKRKTMITIIIILGILLAICLYLLTQAIKCKEATDIANQRLENYQASNFTSSYGNISYIIKGKGIPILVFHGIFGGYDQAYETLKSFEKDYQLICPSRFGYLNSDMPENATVLMQVKAFSEFLDYLKLDKVFLLATSAGATPAIKFALEFPEKTQGLILISPAAPLVEKPAEKLGYAGPPKPFLSNFAMYLIKPLFPAVMGLSSDSIYSLLPVDLRAKGIIFDSAISNTDMTNNYDEYKIENLNSPTIIFQAKDDKMAYYDKTAASIKRFPNCLFVSFETGGHMLEGQNVDSYLKEFTAKNYPQNTNSQ